MFGSIGTFVYRMRYTVIGVLIALMGGLGLYGMSLPNYLSQSGWFDPGSESVHGSIIADNSLGRDHKADVLLLVTPPEGVSIDDPSFGDKMVEVVDGIAEESGGIISRVPPSGPDDTEHAGLIDPFQKPTSAADEIAQTQKRDRMWNMEENKGFVSIGIRGNDDTEILANYKAVEPLFDNLDVKYDMPGTTFQLAGLQPIAGSMSHGMEQDIKRAELIALPVVALMLLFVFGGVVAAVLPVFIGGLTIAGSLGIMTVLAQLTELNVFAQSVVTLIGLGIAIDYGLFIVSRFREEIADGYTIEAAVRRTVMTSGQTIAFSATIIIAALACVLMYPQAFLRSVAYGAIASVALAAVLSITVLPAILGILGRRIDAFSVPFLRRTRTRAEIISGFWGKLSSWVMKHPVKVAVPTVLLLLALIIPFGNIVFGGMSERYLPPNDTHRLAQEEFDATFPAERSEEVKLVVVYDPNDDGAEPKIQAIAAEANEIPGFTKKFSPAPDQGGLDGVYEQRGAEYGVVQMSAGLRDRDTAAEAIKELRGIDHQGLMVYVAGTPALTQDSMDTLMGRLPLMAVTLVLVTGLLMFLAFGSVILPIKASLMSALGLGSTLGILTWMFVDGHGADLLNYTAGPLFGAVLVLIIAIVYGLSTDYEIFLVSRMVEARQNGASTTEAIRDGTALTGRIITAAAAILVVVTGAFALSNIVLMKYLAFGMIAALILDATVIRMLLVPSVMKLLGDDNWWAPQWMLKLQRKIGLGEAVLEDEPEDKDPAFVPAGAVVATSAGTVVAAAQAETTQLRVQQPGDGHERTAAGKAEPRGRRAVALLGRKRDSEAPETIDDADAAGSQLSEGHLDDVIAGDGNAQPGGATGPASGTQSAVGTRGRGPAPQNRRPAPAPVAPPVQEPLPARTPPRRGEEGPDTGQWKLGDGGVRLGNRDLRPRPQPMSQQAPQQSPHTAPAPAPQNRPTAPAGGTRPGPESAPMSGQRPANAPRPAQYAPQSPAQKGRPAENPAPKNPAPQEAAAPQNPAPQAPAPQAQAPQAEAPQAPAPQAPAPSNAGTPRPQAGPYPGPTGGGENRMPPQYGRPADPLDPNVSIEQLQAEAPRAERRSGRRERSDQISVHELLRRTRDANRDTQD